MSKSGRIQEGTNKYGFNWLIQLRHVYLPDVTSAIKELLPLFEHCVCGYVPWQILGHSNIDPVKVNNRYARHFFEG